MFKKMYYYAPIPAHCCDYAPKITDYALGICNYASKTSLIIRLLSPSTAPMCYSLSELGC